MTDWSHFFAAGLDRTSSLSGAVILFLVFFILVIALVLLGLTLMRSARHRRGPGHRRRKVRAAPLPDAWEEAGRRATPYDGSD